MSPLETRPDSYGISLIVMSRNGRHFAVQKLGSVINLKLRGKVTPAIGTLIPHKAKPKNFLIVIDLRMILKFADFHASFTPNPRFITNLKR